MTITWTYEDALALMNPGDYVGVLRGDADTVLRYMNQTTDILAKRCGGELSFNALCQMRIAEDDARELFKLNNKYPRSSHDLNLIMETMRSIQGMALAKIHQQVITGQKQRCSELAKDAHESREASTDVDQRNYWLGVRQAYRDEVEHYKALEDGAKDVAACA